MEWVVARSAMCIRQPARAGMDEAVAAVARAFAGDLCGNPCSFLGKGIAGDGYLTLYAQRRCSGWPVAKRQGVFQLLATRAEIQLRAENKLLQDVVRVFRAGLHQFRFNLEFL